MAMTTTNTAFSSTWDIDQLIQTGTAVISSPSATITATPNSPTLQMFEVQFQPTGSSKWFQVGYGTISNNIASGFYCYSSIDTNNLYFSSLVAGNLRFFFWEDRIDY